MLLRLLALIVLSVLCSTNQNIPDNSQFFNEQKQQFENPPPGWDTRLRRSLEYNFTDVLGSPVGAADMSVMFPDTSICDVILNSKENVSINEIPFFCICTHCKATIGPKGERGDRGPEGIEGSPGRRGLTGFRGLRGFTGPQGAKGQKGNQGDKGAPGPIGFPGMKGELGVKGENGNLGDDGTAGPVGPQGVAGSCLCEPVIGPRGLPGAPGPAGARGLPGATGSKGAAGNKGDKGDKGLNGRNGANGLKGAQGESGPCNCTDGVDGANGLPGTKGDAGMKGNIGLKGAQGDMGIKGNVGDPGTPGMPGPCSLAVQSAFCVGLETPFPAMNKPVRFTRLIYNVQGHYNPSLGIFIAPVNGTYVCKLNLAVKTKMLVIALFHNFYPVLKMAEATNMAITSQSVVLHLTARDMVWLQVKDTNSNGMYADGEVSSTFSCFLLSPDSCDFGIYRDFKPVNWDEIAQKNFTWI